MSKSGPIFCKTVQKSWGAGIGHRAVAVEADFRAPVCAMEGCTLPGSPSLCFCSVKRSCLIMRSWRASRGTVGASAGPPRFPSFPPFPARRLLLASFPVLRKRGQYKTAIVERNGVVWHLRTEAGRCCGTGRFSSQIPRDASLDAGMGRIFDRTITCPVERQGCIGAALRGCNLADHEQAKLHWSRPQGL